MAENKEIAALVNQMPDADKDGKYTGPTWAAAQKVIEGVLAGGRESIIALLDLLTDDKGTDYKARYTLHAMALYCGAAEKQGLREAFVNDLVSQLWGNRPNSVKVFIIRELQVVGDAKAAPTLGRMLIEDELSAPAAAALTAIGAVEQLRPRIPAAKGRNLLNIVQAMGVLRDVSSIPTLRSAARSEDADVRVAAVWSLANIGDASAVDVVIKAADATGWERAKAAKACLMLAEKLNAAGDKASAAKIYQYLQRSRSEESERYVRELAEAAMKG